MTAVPLEDDPEAGRLAARVERTRERLTLTRDGEPVAVVISAEELAGLEDTVEIVVHVGSAPTCTAAAELPPPVVGGYFRVTFCAEPHCGSAADSDSGSGALARARKRS